MSEIFRKLETRVHRALLILFPVVFCGACSLRQSSPSSHMSGSEAERDSQIVLLGTGTPHPDPDRSGPAVAIIVNGTPYLIDAGPGIVRRAAAAQREGVKALRASNLKHVFITHLHSDHTLGLADLIFTPWVLERDEPLQLYGPPGVREMVEHLLKAYDQDVRMRIDGLEPANTEGYKVDVHEIAAGEIYRDANVTVQAIAVNHGSWEYAFGFRFETPDRTIVISGDTSPSDALTEAARGCDVLIHEVYSQAGFERRISIWQQYHSSFHTSTIELGRIARLARPGLLVLYHQLYWGADDAGLLEEIARIYDGPVVSGADLDRY